MKNSLYNLVIYAILLTTQGSNVLAQSNPQVDPQCDTEYNKIIGDTARDQQTAAARGDFAEITRLNLVRSIKIRDLYSTTCSNASRAKGRREVGQRGIDMNSSLCQQYGMGPQCAAPPVYSSPSQSTTATIQPGNTSNGSGVGALSSSSSRGEWAGNCLSVARPPNAWADLTNNCSYDVEARWCYIGLDCKNGDWGLSNQGTIRAGQTRSASSQGSRSSQYNIVFNACKGANSPISEPSKGTIQCP
jgi:hypothetical protein